jgi:hypothetical protein
METTDLSAQDPEQSPSEALRAQIAAKIREDSQNLADLTPSAALVDFFAGLSPEEAEPILVDLLNDEQYADIKALTTSDDLYFFSSRYLEPPRAEEQVLIEEVLYRIATTVRQESRETAQLTHLPALNAVLTDLQAEDAEAPLNATAFLPLLLEDERYQDITSISIPGGAVLLYSQQFITSSYAKLLARTEGGDPLATIADTVREESRIYPRPTDVRLFLEPPFNMTWDEITAHIDQLLGPETYGDIVKLVASTGTIYLFSEKHMTPGHARSIVEWEEVERYENP